MLFLCRKRIWGIKITKIARNPNKTVKFSTDVEFFTHQKIAAYYCAMFENMTQSVKKQHTISGIGAAFFRVKKISIFIKNRH